jgi:hypothetical protein
VLPPMLFVYASFTNFGTVTIRPHASGMRRGSVIIRHPE